MREARLPVRPIYFDAYDSELPELVVALGDLAAQAEPRRQAVQRLEGIYAHARPEQIDAILEVIQRLLEEGRDPERILSQLAAIRASTASGALLQASARVAGDLSEELRMRQTVADGVDAQRSRLLSTMREALAEIDLRRHAIGEIAQKARDDLHRQARESFELMILSLPAELRWALEEERLSSSRFAAALQWRQIIERSVKFSLEFVRRRFEEWERACQTEILYPELSRVTFEMTFEAASVDRWAGTYLQVPERFDLTDEVDRRHLPALTTELSRMDISMPEISLSPLHLFSVLSASLSGSFEVERVIKRHVAEEMRAQIRRAGTEGLKKIDRDFVFLLHSVVERAYDICRTHLEEIAQRTVREMEGTQRLRLEARQSTVQLDDVAARMAELHHMLDVNES